MRSSYLFDPPPLPARPHRSQTTEACPVVVQPQDTPVADINKSELDQPRYSASDPPSEIAAKNEEEKEEHEDEEEESESESESEEEELDENAKALSVRITGLPPEVATSDVAHFFIFCGRITRIHHDRYLLPRSCLFSS